MAHFAQLDKDDNVIHVSVVANDRLDPEDEEGSGITLQRRIHGGNTRWAQTFYSAAGEEEKRFRFAGVGYRLRRDIGANGAFVAPKPLPSSVLDLSNGEWNPPLPKPEAPGEWAWDEDDGLWVDRTGAVDNVTFALRFSGTEKDGIQASSNPIINGFEAELKRTPIILPLHPRTQAGMDALEADDLLDGPGRREAILGL